MVCIDYRRPRHYRYLPKLIFTNTIESCRNFARLRKYPGVSIPHTAYDSTEDKMMLFQVKDRWCCVGIECDSWRESKLVDQLFRMGV